MEDRHLTFIIVPHGELETRTFQVSYRRLKLLLVLAAALLLVFCVLLALWFPALTQAARVPGLERELAALETERARVAELAQTLAEVEAQYERVRQLLGADAAVTGEAPTLPPLSSGTNSVGRGSEGVGQSPKALPVWPIAGGSPAAVGDRRAGSPDGLELPAPADTEVKAAADGTVLAAGDDPAFGRYVFLDHGAGLQTVYAHAGRLFVKRGARVRAGEVIALSGASGRATAPHLHFEVRRDGAPVDPLTYLRQP